MSARIGERTRLFATVGLALFACGRSTPDAPPSTDAWARSILAMPIADVCERGGGNFCIVRASLIPDDVRALGVHSITLQQFGNERYLDFDWGGGHVEAYGVLIGPIDWAHEPNTERGERRLRAGVFAYDTRL